MTEDAKRIVYRIGLGVLLVSLLAGVISVVVAGGRPPGWVYACFAAGVLVAVVPGFVPTKPGSTGQ